MKPKHLSWVLLLLWGCATGSGTAKSPGEEKARPGVAFIEDDYGAALRMAREKRVPIFVDAWALACHPCRSMRATVFTDPALEKYQGRFIWLALNTDLPANEPFLERFPVDTFPTLLVLEPDRETLLTRVLGSLSVSELIAFLERAEHAFQQGHPKEEERIARADALASKGAHAEAVTAYQEALSNLPADAAARAGAVMSLLKSLAEVDRADECARVAAREAGQLPGTSDQARVLYPGIGCAMDLETEEAKPLRARMAEQTTRLIATPAEALTPDLRSALYEALVELRHASGDDAEGVALARKWLAFVEENARNARSAEERSALDAHRMMAAMLLEKPERAIPALEQSEREHPTDYSPPFRLAFLYLRTGQRDQALQASDRALALASGGARGMVLAGRAQILLARGERAQAERMLTDALRDLESAPDGYGTRQQRKALERALNLLLARGGASEGSAAP
jgi:tetratricopeptide (TPR) repeat protein